MLSDPIVALATPPGRSAIAVVRVSGVGALEVVERVVPGIAAFAPRMATLARFVAADGTLIDRGVATRFRAPASFTGEDLVELSCHGGLATPARLLAAPGIRPYCTKRSRSPNTLIGFLTNPDFPGGNCFT